MDDCDEQSEPRPRDQQRQRLSPSPLTIQDPMAQDTADGPRVSFHYVVRCKDSYVVKLDSRLHGIFSHCRFLGSFKVLDFSCG